MQALLGRVFAEGDRVAKGRPRLRAGGKHELVVGHVHAAPAADNLLLRLDLRDRVVDETRTVVVGDVGQCVFARVSEVERLGHFHRPIGEPRLGRDQRDRDPVAGEVAESHQGLEGGDAAAGDHHVGGGGFGHGFKLRAETPGAISPNSDGTGGELRMPLRYCVTSNGSFWPA